MKLLKRVDILLLSLFVSVIVLVNVLRPSRPTNQHVQILEQISDERGLTSVIFLERGDTFALDYLTAAQLDSLKSR